MKPHPRIRKTVKWGGLAASMVLLVALIASIWVRVWWSGSNGGGINLMSGRIYLVWGYRLEYPDAPGWHMGLGPRRVDLWFRARRDTGPGFYWLAVPLWLPVALAVGVTCVAWRRDVLARKVRQGVCPSCSYDRTGLAPGAVCPDP